MEPWLAEYEAEEEEASQKLVQKLLDYVEHSYYIPSITEVARTAYGDKFEFQNLVAYHPLCLCNSLNVLLPFNEQVVVVVQPCKHKKDFIQTYTLKPEEVAYLYKKKRLLPIIGGDPISFKEDVGDYMDVLLKERPPTLARVPSFVYSISGGKSQEHLKAGEQMKRKLKTQIKRMRKPLPFPRGRIWVNVMPIFYCYLHSLGLGVFADSVVDRCDPSIVPFLMPLYCEILAYPYILGLGASPQLPRWLEAVNLMAPTDFPKIEFSKLTFPFEVGQFLTDFYKLAFPSNPRMETIDKAYRDKALQKARKLLCEFDKAIRDTKMDTAVQKGKDLKEVFLEAYEAIPTLDKRSEKWKWILRGVAYGAIGSIGMLTYPAAGLLAGIGYRVLEQKVTEFMIPKLAGMKVNPLSTAIWEFKKHYKNIQELQDEVKQVEKLSK